MSTPLTLPVHRMVEAACRVECAKRGRTWLRMRIEDRQALLDEVLASMKLADAARWGSRYTVADIMNTKTAPGRGQHERVKESA